MAVEDTPVHESGKRDKPRAGCFDRQPFAHQRCVQDGWLPDGRRRMVLLLHTASTKCRQILDLPECEGCSAEKDHEYINKMKELSK